MMKSTATEAVKISNGKDRRTVFGVKKYKIVDGKEVVISETPATIPKGYEVVSDEDFDNFVDKNVRNAEILQELDAIDKKTIRPLRAGETDRLKELEDQAVELRKELNRAV